MAAIAHGEATNEGNYKEINKQYNILRKIYILFKNNQGLALRELPQLISHENIYVKLWASAHALALNINVSDAEKSLETISKRTDVIGFEAKMTLKEWQKGNLKF